MLVAAHVIDSNFIRWGSSEYRAAQQEAVESLAVLVDQSGDNPYLSFAHWLSQFTLPWSLLFLGEWGEALRIVAAEIALADKNGDRYRGQTLRLHTPGSPARWAGGGWRVAGQFSRAGGPALRPWRRFASR
jgi:hypothetical protein